MGQVSFEVPGPGTYNITADPTLAPLDSPGAAADVLTGKQFYRSDNTPVTGTMPNNPPTEVKIEAGGSYTIPQGYHSGTGTVTSQGTALPTLDNPGTAADLLAGRELIDGEGEKVTGAMANNGAVNETLSAGDSYTIPAGYHNGNGSVAAASLSSQTPGTADAGDIVSGQTAWVNGEQITGTLEPGYQTSDATATAGDILDGKTAYIATGKVTGAMPNNNAVTETLDAGAAYTIPAGYHNGQGTVTAKSLASQTQGTATAEDIMQGETAWVNGQQITGTATPGTDISDATATADQILSPYTAYVASGKVTGNIPTNTDDDVTISDDSVIVSAGYYADAVSKAIPTVAQAVPSITVSKTGLITATATQDAGYVAQGTESATQQLPTQSAQTITPTTTAQTIAADVYLTGAQTIQGDANLVSGNIKDGVSIFGVSGSYTGKPGAISVPLVVTVTTGATVTAVNGDTTLTATSVDGTATLTLTRSGDWTVSAAWDGETSNSVVITIPTSYDAWLQFSPVIRVPEVTAIYSRSCVSAAVVGEYALIAGGRSSSSSGAYSIVQSYDTALTLRTETPLGNARFNIAGGSIGRHAVFAGGYSSNSTVHYDVDAYDDALSHTLPTELSENRTELAATTIGNYLLFGGGNNGRTTSYSDVDAYNLSLTRTTPSNLSEARGSLAATTVGGYALFGGGASYENSHSVTVDAYNSSLTRTTATQLRAGGERITATTAGEYALFGGGNWKSGSAIVDAYDLSLTRIPVTDLSAQKWGASAVTLEGYAMFCGGASSSRELDTIDMYDSSLTRISPSPAPLSAARQGAGAAHIGDYALLAGGGNDVNSPISGTDAYTLTN